MLPEGERDRKGTASAGGTVCTDRSVHHLNDILGDSQAETCSVHAAESSVPFPLKGFKDMFQELPADADAGIFDHKLINCLLVGKLFLFDGDNIDLSIVFGVLYGVIYQVQEDLGQFRVVGVDIRMNQTA